MVVVCKMKNPCAIFTAVFFLGWVNFGKGEEAKKPEMEMIFEFRGGKDELVWTSVDDGVMGGLSEGKAEMKDGVLVFSGAISLENNGGFSSVRCEGKEYDFSGKSGLILRVKGDGRVYKLRLETDALFNGSEIGYQADFKTEAGKFVELILPFAEFLPSWRGRDLDGPPLDLTKVKEIRMFLADGRAGAFQIEVDWIGVK